MPRDDRLPRQMPSRLGKLQKDLLQYLREREGLKPIRFSKGDVGTPFAEIEMSDEMSSRFYELIFTELATEPPRKQGLPWSVKDFLGRKPTASESTAIGRALEALEVRGLVIRTQSRGKRKRTSHVRLTREGQLIASLL